MANKKKRILKKILSATVIIAVVLVFFSFGATKVIYDSCFPRYDGSVTETCTELDKLNETKTKNVFSSGKNKLTGYLFPPCDGNSESLIILAQGMNATYSDYLWIIKAFSDNGYGVFVFDPTGCGESEGDSAIGFPQMLNDLEAALSFLKENNNFGYDSLFLFGHSRGGYAVCCATAFEYDITAVVSVNGINSAMEGVMMPAVKVIGNMAYTNYPLLWLYQALLFGADTVDASAVEALVNTETPALVIHAAGDAVVPEDRFSIVSHKEDAAHNNVVWLPNYGPETENAHTNILFDDNGKANSDLIKLITDFFDKAAAEKAARSKT